MDVFSLTVSDVFRNQIARFYEEGLNCMYVPEDDKYQVEGIIHFLRTNEVWDGCENAVNKICTNWCPILEDYLESTYMLN